MQRIPLLAAAIAASSIVVPAGAADCAAGNVCGTVVLRAASSATVRLDLPQETTLQIASGGVPDVGPGRAVAIEGGSGALAGFAIVQDVPNHNAGAGLVFTRIPEQSRASGVGYTWGGFGTTRGGQPSKITFPAGGYHLYALSDSPIEVTLRFPGLPGEATIDATQPAVFHSELVPGRVPGPGAGVYSMGSSRVVDGPSVVFGVFPMVAQVHAATAFGYCATTFLPEDPTGDDVAFLPGCPTSVTSARLTATAITSPGPYYQRADILSAVVPPSRYGIGYWYAGAVVADTGAQGVQAWFALD